MKPIRITIPKSACRAFAAAIGPGVGGTKVCVAYKPVDKATAIVAIDTPVRFPKDLFKEDKIT
ncbi:hypothetical protein SDC9_96808 [bioreactor metagenome]|uniref:Uncharacterized protein n=1 Tax=bioreactor metagenome TaxID=1076179 RepID=A0A645AK79_9ZZZZ